MCRCSLCRSFDLGRSELPYLTLFIKVSYVDIANSLIKRVIGEDE